MVASLLLCRRQDPRSDTLSRATEGLEEISLIRGDQMWVSSNSSIHSTHILTPTNSTPSLPSPFHGAEQFTNNLTSNTL